MGMADHAQADRRTIEIAMEQAFQLAGRPRELERRNPLAAHARELPFLPFPWQAADVFARRTRWGREENAFTRAVEESRRSNAPLLDLTVSNPTRTLPHGPE